MKKTRVKAIAKEFQNGWLLLPATMSDKIELSNFCKEAGEKYINVTAEVTGSLKTYDQCKTVFALIALIFEVTEGYKPTQTETRHLYEDFLDLYADRRPSILNPQKTVPIPLSEMDAGQAAKFINALINHIVEFCDLDKTQQITVQELFEQILIHRTEEALDAVDKDEYGQWLSIEEFKQKNPYSFATGKVCDLDVAHIIARGANPGIEDCCWNVMILTREEHQWSHTVTEEKFLQAYPHLTPRFERAKKLAAEYDSALTKTTAQSLAEQALFF